MVTAIRVEGLASFGATTARRSFDLDAPHDEILGYLGPNAAGSGEASGCRCRVPAGRAAARCGAADQVGE